MSSKRSSNKNINQINEQINHLTLNLNPNETNNNNNPLINVYSNITSPKSSSSNSVQKLSELEEKLKEIFPTNTTTRYNTIILTGAIGLGKSTIAVICLLYLLYRLLCLKDPYLYYGMQPIDKLSISLMNITIENAKGVALDKMNQMILASE